MGLKIERLEDGVRLLVKVVPGASRSEIAGVLGERLKVRVNAPPEGGKANEAVVALLADALGVATRDIQIESGHTRPEKTLRIRGVRPESLDPIV